MAEPFPEICFVDGYGRHLEDGMKSMESQVTSCLAMKYVALLSGGKDSCFNLLHCARNGHELVAAASLGPELGKGSLRSHYLFSI